MSAISTILARLRAAIWAIDVRDDIANAIEQCYSDVSNPTLKTEALEAALQNKIDEGEMAALTIGDHTITAAKLAQGVIDNTLATSGAAADAKKTGDEITAIKADLSDVNERIDNLDPLSEDAKIALLNCFEHVAWVDEHGQDYYDALENALYPDTGLVSISAVFTQAGTFIYPTTPLNDLKAYLVVTGHYNDGTSKTITDYALSGTLEVGTSTVTVSKEGKTTTFDVVVTQPYWDYEWDASSEELPAGMTASAYNFTTETGALYAENPALNLDYLGDMRIFIEAKLYAFNTELQQESYRNIPQVVISNGNSKGCKLIASYGNSTSNPNAYVAFGVNNVNTIVDGIKGTEWHTYDINSVSGVHTLKVDDVTADIPQNQGTSQYLTMTGITTGTPASPLVYIMYIKQFKYKKL